MSEKMIMISRFISNIENLRVEANDIRGDRWVVNYKNYWEKELEKASKEYRKNSNSSITIHSDEYWERLDKIMEEMFQKFEVKKKKTKFNEDCKWNVDCICQNDTLDVYSEECVPLCMYKKERD